MNIAVIPARGGSKRIPRKNLKAFAGRPVIAWSIEACADSGLFDRIVVSTDDEEIAEAARSFGAEVPFMRPTALSDDHAGTDDVMAHAASELPCDLACCVYATAPFVRASDLRAGRERMHEGWDYAFSAASYPHSPFRAFTLEQGGVRMLMPQHYHTRSQDLPEAWHDAAQFYWGTRDAWRERRMLFGERSTIVPIPRWRVQDIDTPEDWRRAEVLHRVLQELPHED